MKHTHKKWLSDSCMLILGFKMKEYHVLQKEWQKIKQDQHFIIMLASKSISSLGAFGLVDERGVCSGFPG